MSKAKEIINNIGNSKRIRIRYIEPKGYTATDGVTRRNIEGTIISRNEIFIVINSGRYKTTINYDMIEDVSEVVRKKRTV